MRFLSELKSQPHMGWTYLCVGFPFITILLVAVTLLCGGTVGRWQAPLAWILCCMGVAWLAPGGVKSRWLQVGKFSAGLAGLILLATMVVGPTDADSTAAHHAGIFFLAQGWNPIYEAMPDSNGYSFFAEQVQYVPRAMWYFCAALYRSTGWIEAGHMMGLLLLVAAGRVVGVFCQRCFALEGWKKWVAVLILLLPPWNYEALFSARNDIELYCLIAILGCSGVLYFKERNCLWLWLAILTMPFLVSMKYFCILVVVVASLVIALGLWLRQGPWKAWCVGVMGAAILSIVMGVSPYLTNVDFLLGHQSAQSDQHYVMTKDFHDQNDDAKLMGYWGRLSDAYVSQTLTRSYYAWRYDRPNFNPITRVANGVDGLGAVFRLFLWIAVILSFWQKKDRSLTMLYSCMLVLSFCLSPVYMGFIRYIPWLYALPFLVVLRVFQSCSRKKLLVITLTVSHVLISCGSILFLGWRMVLSLENLSVMRAMSVDPKPIFNTNSYVVEQFFKDVPLAHATTFNQTLLMQPNDRMGNMLVYVYAFSDPSTISFPDLQRQITPRLHRKPRHEKMIQVFNEQAKPLAHWLLFDSWSLIPFWYELRWEQFKKAWQGS